MEGGGGASLVESLRAKWICTAVFSSAPHMQIEFLMRIFFYIYKNGFKSATFKNAMV